MEYKVFFYSTPSGEKPVVEFLESLRGTNSALHKLLIAGIEKLKHRDYHGPPLTVPGTGSLGILELRVGRTDIARVFFFRPNQIIVCTNGYVKKSQKLDPQELARRALQGRLGAPLLVEGS